MDVLVAGSGGAGKKRKAPAAAAAGPSGAKRAKRVAPPLETDDESEVEDEAQEWDDSFGGAVDDDELEAFEALEHARGLEPSSDGTMDEDGWASVRTARGAASASASGKKGKGRTSTEVLELE